MACLGAAAEDQLEYKRDIGGGIGTCFYMGDANGTPFKGSNIMCSLAMRRNFNPRMALRYGLSYGRFTGDTNGRYFPKEPGSTEPLPLYDFTGNVLELGCQFELNFWGYGIGPGYKKLSRITPYLLIGLGGLVGFSKGTVAGEQPQNTSCVGMVIPVGLGVKYKIKPRLNLALEWSFRFSTTDRLDGEKMCDPYFIKSGFYKNKDTYSFFQVTLSYDISPKYRKCNN